MFFKCSEYSSLKIYARLSVQFPSLKMCWLLNARPDVNEWLCLRMNKMNISMQVFLNIYVQVGRYAQVYLVKGLRRRLSDFNSSHRRALHICLVASLDVMSWYTKEAFTVKLINNDMITPPLSWDLRVTGKPTNKGEWINILMSTQELSPKFKEFWIFSFAI